MKTISVLSTAVAVLSNGADSRNLVENQPRATGAALLPEHGILPKPTPPPGLDDFHQGFFKRATTAQTPLTMMIAPDNTCGWVSASSAAPYTCGGRHATCGLILGQANIPGAVMCFNSEAFNFNIACVDYDSYFSSSACDRACSQNPYTTKCTSGALPYCNTIAFPGGITDYWCNSVEYSTARTAQTTWVGQSSRRSYSVFVQNSSGYLDATSFPTNAFNADPSATGSAAGGESRTSDGDSKRDSKTPIGAIVGGVVGGVAVIGLGLLALFFFLRRKNSRKAGKMAKPSSNQSPMQPNASTGMSTTQNHNQAYYPPKFNGPLPTQTYPTQQQYPQPTPPSQPQGGFYPQASVSPSSPTASHVPDPQISQTTTSPTPTWLNAYATPPPGPMLQSQPLPQPQQHQTGAFQPVQVQQQQPQQVQPQPRPQGQPQQHQSHSQKPVHEVSAQTSDNHRGQMQEMA
ncbi:hypothetical protein E4U21_007342 [Claviceps maximensis]|nr:hypothetical protein E4U21_007342 [Claviceps maximensis]